MAFGGVDLPSIRQRLLVDDSELGKVGGRFGKLGSMLGTAVKAGALAAAAGVGAFVAAGVKGAVDVERGLREVVTLFGETGAEAEASVAGLTSQTRELSDTVGIAQQELVGGLYQAISAGVPRDNAFEFMQVASKAAIAGVTDVETSVDGLTTIINAFGLESDDAQRVADSMFQTVKDGKTNFEELSSSIFQVAPAAAAAGVGFEEVNAAVATLTAAGTPTSVATTQIRQAISELAKPGTAVAETFERIAGKSFRQFIEEGGDMQGALAVLQEEAEATGAKVGDYFGSVEAAAAATSLADTQAAKFAETLDNQADAAGSVEAGFQTMQESTSRQWDMFVTKATNVAISLGSVLLPAVNAVMGVFSDALIPVLERVGAVIGVLVDGDLSGLARMLGLTGEQAEAGTSKVMSTFTAMREFVAEAIEQVRAVVASTLEAMEGRFGSIMSSIGAIVKGAVELIMVLWRLFGDDLLTFLSGTFQAIMRIVDGALKIVRGIIDTVLGLLTGDWSRAWDGIKMILSGVWDVIAGIVQRAIETVRLIIGAGFDLVRTIVGDAWNALVGIFRDKIADAIDEVHTIKDAIVGFFAGAADWLRDAGRKIIAGLVSGITDKIQAVKDAASKVTGAVRRFLPGSPAKEGPFSGQGAPERLGARLAGQVAQGMAGEAGTVAKAAGQVARAASIDATGRVGVGVGSHAAGGVSAPVSLQFYGPVGKGAADEIRDMVEDVFADVVTAAKTRRR